MCTAGMQVLTCLQKEVGWDRKSTTDSAFVCPSKQTIQNSLIVLYKEHLLFCKHCPEFQLDLLNDLKSKQIITYTKVVALMVTLSDDMWSGTTPYL